MKKTHLKEEEVGCLLFCRNLIPPFSYELSIQTSMCMGV